MDVLLGLGVLAHCVLLALAVPLSLPFGLGLDGMATRIAKYEHLR